MGFHGPELIIVLVVALLIFGPKKLPEMGSSIGKSLREFRKGMNEITNPKDTYEEETKLPQAPDVSKLHSAAIEASAPEVPVAPVESSLPELSEAEVSQLEARSE